MCKRPKNVAINRIKITSVYQEDRFGSPKDAIAAIKKRASKMAKPRSKLKKQKIIFFSFKRSKKKASFEFLESKDFGIPDLEERVEN